MNASLATSCNRRIFGFSINRLRAGYNLLQKTTQIFKALCKYSGVDVLNKILKKDIHSFRKKEKEKNPKFLLPKEKKMERFLQ